MRIQQNWQKGFRKNWTIPDKAEPITNEDITPDSHEIKPNQPLAVLVEGKFPFAYKGKEIPAWTKQSKSKNPAETFTGEEKDAPEGTAPNIENIPARAIVVGCADMFNDRVITSAGNPLFFMNAVDALALGDELISIRSKGKAEEFVKNKQIFIALTVFFVLIGIYLIALRKPEKPSVVIGYQSIMKDFSPKKVTKIELYKGTDKKNGIILQKGPSGWEAENSFQAPADHDKIQKLLEAFGDIEGKTRATGKEFFENFHLSEDNALHLTFTVEGALPPLLIGKRGEDKTGTFVRLSDKDDILLVDKDLYSDLGIWGERRVW